MSENIPESVPTSQDPRSKRPLKRRALSPTSRHASEVEALFANPERDVAIPDGKGSSKKSGLPPPPEIVANVQGSSAGAGSGEFHVYKASRRREYERLKTMEEENARELADTEYEKKQEENKAKEESKTEKNRKKREKKRQKKAVKGSKQDESDIMQVDGSNSRKISKVPKTAPAKLDGTEDENQVNDIPPASVTQDQGVIIHDED